MFKRFKNIKPSTLLIHLIVTLAYPAAKAALAPVNQLQVFIDVMTIIALMLLFIGVFYSLFIRGDYDISGFFLRRGMKQGEKNFDAYESDMKEKREAVFNYPLFLGLLYLIVAALVAYTVL